MRTQIRHNTLFAAALLVTALSARILIADSQPFRVTLPPGFGAFARSAQTAKSPHGMIQVTNWVSKSPTGEAVVVSVSKMPAKIDDPQKLMNSTRDSLVKSLNATLDSQQNIDGTPPGMRINFHNDSAYLRTRLTVTRDELFQLLYVGRTAEQRNNPSVDSLFQSFVISPSETADAIKPAGAARGQ